MRLSFTDEGIYLMRLAWRDPATHKVWVQHGTRNLWDGDYPVEQFGHHIGGAVMDVVEWTVQ